MHGWGDRGELSNEPSGNLEASSSATQGGPGGEPQGTASICDLNAKPLLAVNAWLKNYEALWGESMHSLKNYIEETEHQKEKNL
jgi:hypothetical protein